MPPKKPVTAASKSAPAAAKSGSKPSGAKGSSGAKKPTKVVKKSWKSMHKHLFDKTPRNFGVGRHLPHKRDLTHFVRWPHYVRVQRQRAILKKRLKVPPAINHFTKTLEANQAGTLFRILSHYRPETSDEKKTRLTHQAKQESKGKAQDPSKKPKLLKFGLNHVTQLVESKKAKLVVIAHDVDPVELVVWLPALCRRMDVPYVIVKSKARLGHLVHLKTAAVVAVTDVRREHQNELDNFVANVRHLYNDNVADRKKWGGGVLGAKAVARLRRKEKAKAKDALKKA